TPDVQTAASALTADDWMLLAQIGRSVTVGELLSRSALSEAHTVIVLERLVALQVISLSKAEGGATPSARLPTPSAAKTPVAGGAIQERVSTGPSEGVSEAQRARARSSVEA